MKKFQVNYLLSMSRLPDHFYAMVHGLSGRDAQYQNPGVSLRSYLVAQQLRRETVQIGGTFLNTIAECEQFSTDPVMISKITEMLMKQVSALIEKMTAMDPKKFATYISELHGCSHAVKMTFDTFIMTQDPSKNTTDILSIQGTNLKEALFELNDKVNEVDYVLSKIPEPVDCA